MADRTLEHIELNDTIGMIEQHSLEERIRRATHDPPLNKPLNPIGGRSHCWLCRRADERGEGEGAKPWPP